MIRPSSTPVEHTRKSYQGILKSAALLGSARVMTLVIGLARGKALAVLIGPVGVGLIGTYDVLVQMAIYVFGMGVQASGVRQVAIANSQQDPDRTARTIATLRCLSWSLGLFGTVVVGASAWAISRLTFKDPGHGRDILILSPAILLTSIYAGGLAILQGCQRIADLAKITVLSAIPYRGGTRGAGGERPQPLLLDRGAGGHPLAGRPGRAVRARVEVRRARPVRQGQPAALRQQLRRHDGAEGRRHPGRPDRREPRSEE